MQAEAVKSVYLHSTTKMIHGPINIKFNSSFYTATFFVLFLLNMVSLPLNLSIPLF